MVQPSQPGITIQTQQQNVKQARIIPRNGYYVGEVIYERKEAPASLHTSLYGGIDIGLNNLAAVTSNKAGFHPRIVNGRPIKSINQWYNKERARLQTLLAQEKRHTSHQLNRLTNRRTRRSDHYLHTASKRRAPLDPLRCLVSLFSGFNCFDHMDIGTMIEDGLPSDLVMQLHIQF